MQLIKAYRWYLISPFVLLFFIILLLQFVGEGEFVNQIRYFNF